VLYVFLCRVARQTEMFMLANIPVQGCFIVNTEVFNERVGCCMALK